MAPLDVWTAKQLAAVRAYLGHLQQAEFAMRDVGGLRLDSIQRLLSDTVSLEVAVEVPCVLCRRQFLVRVRVIDPQQTVPRGVLCGACDERANAEAKEVRSGAAE